MILTLESLEGCNLNSFIFVFCIAYLFIIFFFKTSFYLMCKMHFKGKRLIMSHLTACIIFFINKIIASAVEFVCEVNPTQSTLKSWIHPWFLVNLNLINWICVNCVCLESLLRRAFSFKFYFGNIWFNQA